MSVDVLRIPRRVKVYELQQENWHDRGTGFCIGEFINDDAYIFVKSEEDGGKYLLETKIFKHVQYQKQQETLIVWTDPDETDLALSFQESDGCATIWDFVTDVQKHLNLDEIHSDDLIDGINGSSLALPPDLTLASLADIENRLSIASNSQYGRESVVNDITQHDYINKLIILLGEAEDLESIADLHTLCRIMKLIILMNDNAILEKIILDECIVGVVGILEYDPEFPGHKANHREYISDESRFKEVVHIPDEAVRNKIKHTFRLQYLKDVVLARLLDDATFSLLNSMIYFYHFEIINCLQHNDEFITALFDIFKPTSIPPTEGKAITSTDPIATDSTVADSSSPLLTTQQPASLAKKRDAVRFVQQFCQTSKNLQNSHRHTLYNNFLKKGLLRVIHFALHDSARGIRIAGAELILSLIETDPFMIRVAVLNKPADEATVVDALIDLLLTETDFGVFSLAAEALQTLLNANSGQPSEIMHSKSSDMLLRQSSDDPETEMFLELFYETPVKRLFDRIVNLKMPQHMSLSDASLYCSLCSLILVFIQAHGYRCRLFLVQSSVLTNLAKLFQSPHKSLKLAVLRCFRQCLSTNDEFYYRHLIKEKLFAPVVTLMLEVASRNNLVNSACLEFFEFVRMGTIRPELQRNMKNVLIHIVSTYGDQLKTISQFDTIRELFSRYVDLRAEAALAEAKGDAKLPRAADHAQWNRLRDIEVDEEEYFNTSDDEAEAAATAIPTEPASEPVDMLVSEPAVEDDKAIDASEEGSLSPKASSEKSSDSQSQPTSAEPLDEKDTEKSSDNDSDKKHQPDKPSESAVVTVQQEEQSLTKLHALSEKRRRKEEKQDDDELLKLSMKRKKQNTGGHSSSSRSSSPAATSKAASKRGILAKATGKFNFKFGSKD
ncbi:component of IIS longevity pathway SMK-1-domain-containing protein [Limtongia smithiae]|uniref:component of IIS longevity pathway SMK-1-domain-containing protein n=1 Tax=Limtongia smithiae TaxID=1125753 RepID=UPI0034CED5A1